MDQGPRIFLGVLDRRHGLHLDRDQALKAHPYPQLTGQKGEQLGREAWLEEVVATQSFLRRVE